MKDKSVKFSRVYFLAAKQFCLSLVFISIIGSQFIWNAENFIKEIPQLKGSFSCSSLNNEEYIKSSPGKILKQWLCQESKIILTSLFAPINTIKGLLIRLRIVSFLIAYSPVVTYSWSWEVTGLNNQNTWEHIDMPNEHIYDNTWSFLINNREPKFMSSISSSLPSREAYLRYLCKEKSEEFKAIRFYYITKNINDPLEFAQTAEMYSTKSQSLIQEFWCE